MRYLKIKDVAKQLGLSERTIFRYIKARKLKAIKLGHWKISEADLNKFLKSISN